MRHRLAATVMATLAFGSSGCVTWRVEQAPPAAVIADPKVEVIQVTRTNSATKLLVYQPRIVNDTLTGLPTEMAIQKLAIPVADISAVATRHTDLGKTFLAGLAVGGGVVVYTLLQSLNQGF